MIRLEGVGASKGLRHAATKAAGAVAATVLALALAAHAATGVESLSPWWFEDGYTASTYIDPAHTTASINTANPGTVELPLASSGLTFAPAAAVALIATAAGIQGWAFDGAAMVRAPQFDLAGTYVGAAWIGGAGNQLAVASPTQVSLAAWKGSAWTLVGTLHTSGARMLAEGPSVTGASASILVGTTTGFKVVAYRDGGLAVVSGAGVAALQGVSGIASASGGSLAAVWAGAAVRVFAWDGIAYRETPTWEAPPRSEPILAVAWFRDGGGYWVLRADGSLTAYGFDGSFVVPIPLRSTVLSLPVLSLATGWGQGDVAALVPSGWSYLDASDGSGITFDPARSVAGLTLDTYETSGRLQSTVLSVGHRIDEVQVDATVPELPAGTSIAYQVSTDGGATWTDVTACVNPGDALVACRPDNTQVPAGSEVVYRIMLSTVDPSKTPVVDATDLFEIATETEATSAATAILVK